jgi:putative ABC transport system permease protein
MRDPGPVGRSLRTMIWKASVDDEVDDELDFHIEMRTRALIARGVPPESARADAVARFGDIDRVNRTCREIGKRRDRTMRNAELLSELRQDIVFAARQMRKRPGFALIAALTLALGIGATTAIFSAVHAVVLRPFPNIDPDRVMLLGDTWRDEPGDMSVGNFAAFTARSTAFTALTALRYSSFNLSDGERPERIIGARVSHGFFDVFQGRPLLGRVFMPEEDVPGRDRVVVLSHRLWRNRFAGDSSLVGKSLRMNASSYTVIGVMTPEFDLTTDSEELWVPIAFTAEQLAEHDDHYLTTYGLLAPGVTQDQARTQLEKIARDLRAEFPKTNSESGVHLQSFVDSLVGNYRPRLYILLGAVAFVLLIACSNVANLLLARGAGRAKEIAIRTALGAGRARIVRQLLTESLLLAIIGGALGLLLAHWSIKLLVARAPLGIPRLDQAALNGPVLAFAIVVACASAIVFGLVPALRTARPNLQSTLKEGGRTDAGASRDRMRSGLVIAEVALALTLLVGAGLLIRSAIHLQQVPLGFDPSGVMSARLALPPGQYASADAAQRAYERIIEGLRRAPLVQFASASSQAPLGPGGNSNGLIPEGKPVAIESAIDTRLRIITPGYFETMRIPLRRGRGFTDRDIAGAQRVMIVNETLARLAFPGEDPLGKRMICCEGGPDDLRWKTIVGIAADTRFRGPSVEALPEFYLPMAQIPPEAWEWNQRMMTIVARTTGDPAQLVTALRAAVAAVDPMLPIYDIATMDERLGRSLAQSRFNTLLLAALGAIGLLLSVVGLYGVLAYLVAQRSHEIGIRMALGATARDVLVLVGRQGMTLVIAGIVLGLGAAIIATRLLRELLFGVTATDPLTFAVVALVLIIAGLLASIIPARRATRVDPTRALNAS